MSGQGWDRETEGRGGRRESSSPRHHVITNVWMFTPVVPTYPTSNTLLISFLQSSDAEILVTKPRLSMQVGTETCKKNLCVQHVHVLTELPFLHTTIAGCATMAPFTYIVGEGVFMYSTVLHTCR